LNAGGSSMAMRPIQHLELLNDEKGGTECTHEITHCAIFRVAGYPLKNPAAKCRGEAKVDKIESKTYKCHDTRLKY
jgi:hypothetical protein